MILSRRQIPRRVLPSIEPRRKYQSGKYTNGELLGFKTIIKPSKEKVHQHYRKLAEQIDNDCAAPQAGLIKHLNPIIRGWCNYYRMVCSKETYNKLNHLLFQKLQRWAYCRHSNKPKSWVNHKYWHTIGYNTWTFAQKVSKENKYIKLYTHPETTILSTSKSKETKALMTATQTTGQQEGDNTLTFHPE